VRYHLATAHLSVPKPDLYYMPGYAWSRTPVEVSINACNVFTRFASLGTKGLVLCLSPEPTAGRSASRAATRLANYCSVRSRRPSFSSAVPGDWWAAYRFVTKEVYGFVEQPQTVPVSEIQHGTSRYLMSDEVWEPTLGTVRSWPERDPHNRTQSSFDAFAFYGAPIRFRPTGRAGS